MPKAFHATGRTGFRTVQTLIYAFDERWEETVPGAIDGSVDILR